MALDYSREYDPSQLIRDTRSFGKKADELLLRPEFAFAVSAGLAAAGFLFQSVVEPFACLAVGVTAYSLRLRRTKPLPLRAPKSSKVLDAHELDAMGRPKRAEGIIYLGNERVTGDEIWISDDMARTHMLFMGTTGSGKTEYLLALVNNAFIHASGFIYVDGKADSSLYAKIYSMARLYGREDDVLVINFQTGAKDIFGAQPYKMSNSLNPFAMGSSGMLTQLVVSLMSSGKGDMWENRAISFVEALMKPLVFLRDNYGLLLDVSVIRDYFRLEKIEELVEAMPASYPGLEMTTDGLRSYLDNLPMYDRAKYQKQADGTKEQHGFITMQLVRSFNSLADTYGYIMRTKLPEIDFLDVFLNRRILVVLLPALEKAPAELTNLGRIIVAALKATMAVGLGARLEGDWDAVIEDKPTTSPSPFICVLDEYGYYTVEGFAVVPAQARSLGFAAAFAGQDLPAFQKSSEKEAESTLANTNTKFCGKLSCTKTYRYFSDLAGQGYFTRAGGYVGKSSMIGGYGYREGDNASIEKFERVTFDELQKNKAGQWHIFFEGRIIRLQSFFADFSKRGGRSVRTLRVNHFIPVARPDAHETKMHVKTRSIFDKVLQSERGFEGVIDTFPDRDIALMADAFESLAGSSRSPVEHVIASLASIQRADGINEAALDELMSAYAGNEVDLGSFDGSDVGASQNTFAAVVPSAGAIDFTAEMLGQARGSARAGEHGVAPKVLVPNQDRDAWMNFNDDEIPTIAAADGVTDVGGLDFPAAEFDPTRGNADTAGGFDFAGGWTETVGEGVFTEPADVTAFEAASIDGFEPEVKAPDGGYLGRDYTEMAIAEIQRRLGDSAEEASMAASVSTEMMARSSQYPINPPLSPKTPEDFILIANRVSDAFALLDEEVREGGAR